MSRDFNFRNKGVDGVSSLYMQLKSVKKRVEELNHDNLKMRRKLEMSQKECRDSLKINVDLKNSLKKSEHKVSKYKELKKTHENTRKHVEKLQIEIYDLQNSNPLHIHNHDQKNVHSHDQKNIHSHDHKNVHTHENKQLCLRCKHDLMYDYKHDNKHDTKVAFMSHDHSHKYDHSHKHDHEYYKHGHKQDLTHTHEHGNKHGHEHGHKHDLRHDHNHDFMYEYKHDHKYDLIKDHEHHHEHANLHAQKHGHEHAHKPDHIHDQFENLKCYATNKFGHLKHKFDRMLKEKNGKIYDLKYTNNDLSRKVESHSKIHESLAHEDKQHHHVHDKIFNSMTHSFYAGENQHCMDKGVDVLAAVMQNKSLVYESKVIEKHSNKLHKELHAKECLLDGYKSKIHH